MIALLLFAQVPALAVPVAALRDERVAVPDAKLVWPGGTRVTVDERDGELVARFDRPLPADRLAAFRNAAGSAIGDLRWNDDSLVLRPAGGWAMAWRQAGAVVTVVFTPPPAPKVADAGAEAGGDDARDAALVAIEADAAAGYPGQARRAAARLAARYPDDARVARAAADTQGADGDVRGAAERYRALAADDRVARRAIAAAPGTAAIGATARDGSDLSQAEFAARIDAGVGARIGVGGAVRHIASRVNGTGRGATVADASLAIVPTTGIRLQLLASAALDDRVTGGGARVVAGSAEAQLRAAVTRHMPDYSTPAQVLAGGYLSRATLGVTYRLTPGLVAQADIGANRYGLAGLAGASDTLTASGGIDYLVRRQFPALGLSYRFEAEYVERLRLAAGGDPLIPLATRENHTLQGLVSGSAGEVQMTALAGWTIDRFGGDGPTASIGIAAPIGIAWRVEASGGITSIARAGFSGQQLYARAQVTRSLGATR